MVEFPLTDYPLEVVVISCGPLLDEAERATIGPPLQQYAEVAMDDVFSLARTTILRGMFRHNGGYDSSQLQAIYHQCRSGISLEIATSSDEVSAKESLFSVLRASRAGDAGRLLDLLAQGRIDGDYGGTCIVGRLGEMRGRTYPMHRMHLYGLGVHTQPIEDWLHHIHAGNTPLNNSHARILEQWLLEFIREEESVRPALPDTIHAMPALTLDMPQRVSYELEGICAAPDGWGAPVLTEELLLN